MTRRERRALEEKHAALNVLCLRLFEARGSLNALARDARKAGQDELAESVVTIRADLGESRMYYDAQRENSRRTLYPPEPVTLEASALEDF